MRSESAAKIKTDSDSSVVIFNAILSMADVVSSTACGDAPGIPDKTTATEDDTFSTSAEEYIGSNVIGQ